MINQIFTFFIKKKKSRSLLTLPFKFEVSENFHLAWLVTFDQFSFLDLAKHLSLFPQKYLDAFNCFQHW